MMPGPTTEFKGNLFIPAPVTTSKSNALFTSVVVGNIVTLFQISSKWNYSETFFEAVTYISKFKIFGEKILIYK